MALATRLVSLSRSSGMCIHQTRWLLVPLCHSSTKTPAKRYKAVVFDMGGVLLPSPFRKTTEWELQNCIPKGTIGRAIQTGGEENAWRKFMRGQLGAEEFVEAFSKECSEIAGCPVSAGLYLQALTTGPLAQPHPAMMEAVQCVRAEGLKTAVLSNNFRLQGGATYLPVDRSVFHTVVESCLEGVCKPDPKIYQLCVDRLGVTPQATVFLDDMGINLKAAAKLGMKTIKVEDPVEALKELEGVLGFPLSGFVPGTRSVPAAMQLPVDQLTKYLQRELDLPDTEPVRIRKFSHGQSNPTYILTFGGRQLVLRKKPPGKLLPSAHAVEREFRVMKALGGVGVPVPKVIALCEDSSVIGTPFYLMEYCAGRVFLDPSLPGLSPEERRAVYEAMTAVLCKIHRVDTKAVGLEDYGKPGEYVARQVHRWTKQYRASETHPIPAMERLIQWFPEHLPKKERTAVVHGDFRLDNLVFHAEKPEVMAVLDWELSTLGDPLCDLATSCLAHFLPPDFPILRGISGPDLSSLGIPSAEDVFEQYSSAMGLDGIANWQLYMSFVFFRVAAILQGVYKRSLTGQASSASAESAGRLAEQMADLAWDFATKEGFRIFNTMPGGSRGGDRPGELGNRGPTQRRSFSTWTGRGWRSLMGDRPFSSAPPSPASSSPTASPTLPEGGLIVSPAGLSPRVQRLHLLLERFLQEHLLSIEQKLRDHQFSPQRWSPHPLMEELKEKARQQGLWNLFIPVETDPESRFGAGLTNLEYAHLCELMGRSLYASEAFNCSPPDTGNMEVLIRYGSSRQQEEWLRPLLEGRIRSCFAMTEPKVASSDATNIEASIRLEDDSYVINGHKWWTSGALDPRCKLCIFMGKTDPSAPRHRQQSMILVPMDTPGVRVVRPLTVYGVEDPPGGHAELLFENVRVPCDNILLGPGRGFEIAQGRLGPGRIHHCMRLVGHAERALELMKDRVKSRVAFGKPLVEQGTILADIARSRIEIEQARLLVLKTAHLMDTVGNKVAAPEIAMIKAVCPSMALRVVDRAIQAFGAAGLSNDSPLAMFYSWARALRLADGPDEVHQAAVAKMELRR